MNRECIAAIGVVLGSIGVATSARAGEDAALKFEPAPVIAGEPAGAAGDDKPQIVNPESWKQNDWTVQILGAVWAPGLSGDVRAPGGTGKASIPMLGLDDPEISPMGQIIIRAGTLHITLSGFGYSANQSSRAGEDFSIGSLEVSEGDSLQVKFDYSSVEASVAWRVWEKGIESKSRPNTGVGLLLDVGVGLRGYDIDFFARDNTTEGSTGAHEMWIEPTANVKLTMEILDSFSVDVGVTAGAQPFGDHTSFSIGVQTGFQWRFTPNAGLEIGYRLLNTNLETGSGSDEFSYDGLIAGLFGGVTVRF